MSDTTPTPELPTIPARTKNTLTLPQQVKLADWCRTCPDDCARKPYGDLASIAEATLKFTVTAANMSSMIEACEIQRIKPDAPPSLEEQLAALRDRLDKAESDSKALRGTLAEVLAGMQALTARVNRLEMHQEQPMVPHPDLPGLPVPAFGAAAKATVLVDGESPFRPEHYAKPEGFDKIVTDAAKSAGKTWAAE